MANFFNKLWWGAQDVVKADTDEDKRRRQLAGQPTLYRDQQLQRPVIQPSQNGGSTIGRGIKRTIDQVNPFDNNRTWQQGTPTTSRSFIGNVLAAPNFIKQKVAPTRVSLEYTPADVVNRKDYFNRNGVNIEQHYNDKKVYDKFMADTKGQSMEKYAREGKIPEEAKRFDANKKKIEHIESLYQRSQANQADDKQNVLQQAERNFVRGGAGQLPTVGGNAKSAVGLTLDTLFPEGSRVDKFAENLQKSGKEDITKSGQKMIDTGYGTNPNDNKLVAGVSGAYGSVINNIGLGTILPGGARIPTGIMGVDAYGDMSRSAKESGKSDLQSVALGGGYSIPMAISEKIGIDRLLGGFGGNIATRGIKGFLTEGLQEGGQQLMENTARNYYDPNQGLVDNVKESAFFGGIAGGTVGGINNTQEVSVPKNTEAQYGTSSAGKLISNIPSMPRRPSLTPLNQGGYIQLPGGKQVNEPVYHGTKAADKIRQEGFKLPESRQERANGQRFGSGVYATRNKNDAKIFIEDGGEILNLEVDKNAKILRVPDDEILGTIYGKKTNYGDPESIKAYFQKRGYDGLEIGDKNVKNSQIVIFDPSKVGVKQQQQKNTPTRKIHPDDQKILADFVDHTRKVIKLSPEQAYQLELDASRVAEHYNIGKSGMSPAKLANAITKELDNIGYGTKKSKKLFKPLDEVGSVQVPGRKPKKQVISTPTKVEDKQKLTKEVQSQVDKKAKKKPIEDKKLLKSFEKSELPTELKDIIGAFNKTDSQYNRKSNKELWASAQRRVAEDPVSAIDYFNKNNNDESVATGFALIQRYNRMGLSKEAGELASDMANRAIENGRATQAYSLMRMMTPEGIVAYTEKQITKFIEKNPKLAKKIDFTEATKKDLVKRITEINKMPEGQERNVKIGQMQQVIDNVFPSSISDKAITLWKAGLLSSFRTHERNIVGNVMNLASEMTAQTVAAPLDILMSLRTKKRKTTATLGGLKEGTKEGGKIAADYLKTGVDTSGDTAAKYNVRHVTWGKGKAGKTAKALTQVVYRPLGAADKPFRYARQSNSMYSQANAEAKNLGLKGDEKAAFIKKYTAKANDTAIVEGETATFANDTFIGDVVSGAKRAGRKSNSTTARAGATALDVIVPFSQVPSAVASQLIKYSPLGLAKGTYDIGRVLVTGNPDLQRKAGIAFGRGATGTAIMGAGAVLLANGLMTGDYPKDEKERALWELEGKTPNSVKVGGKWRSISSVGPQSILLLAGGKGMQDKKEGLALKESVLNSSGYIASQFSDQTFVKGLTNFTDAFTDPKRKLEGYIEGQATSVVPNIIKDIAKGTDPKQREAQGFKEKFMQATPGVSRKLTPKRNVLGEEMKREGGLPGATLDLFNSSTPKSNSLIDEFRRLSDSRFNSTPKRVDKKAEIGGTTVKFTSKLIGEIESTVGPIQKQAFEQIMKDPVYSELGDQEKQNVLTDINQIVEPVENIKAAKKNGLLNDEQFNRAVSNLSKQQQNYLLKGEIKATIPEEKKAKAPKQSLIDAINSDNNYSIGNTKLSLGSSGTSRELPKGMFKTNKDLLEKYYGLDETGKKKYLVDNNDAEYKIAMAEYEADRLSGTLSTAQSIKKPKELAKEKIGSSYTKDTRDLYSVSEAELHDYLTNTPGSQKQYEDLVAYDNALYEAGLVKYRKYKDGVIASGSSSGGRRSSKGTKAKDPKKIDVPSFIAAGSGGKSSRELLKNAKVVYRG